MHNRRIRTRKDKDYYIYRLNIPNEVAEKLQLGEQDYLHLTAQKAAWYHMLDWSKMSKESFDRLPDEVRYEIKKVGLFPIEKATMTVKPK